MSRIGTTKTHIRNRYVRKGSARVLEFLRRFGKLCLIAAFCIWAGAWLWLGGAFGRGAEWAQNKTFEITGAAGFTVDEILVEGRENTDAEVLRALINIDRGDPIFLFDPAEAKDMIERISWVKEAHVERRLPDTIYIGLIERKPVALWQNKKKIRLIDADGVTIADRKLENFRNLIIITGESPLHAAELLALLAAEPLIQERADGAAWVGNRRWDLKLKNGLTVKLPEKDAGYALRRLARAHEEEGLLGKALESVDLREQDRMIVLPSANAAAGMVKADAKGGNI